MTYDGYDKDIRRNDDIRHCTHCKRYGYIAGRCRSRLAAQESRQQQLLARKPKQHHQYQLELDALNEREEAEHATITAEFDAETARIEVDPSFDNPTEHLLQELDDKETSVTWLRERNAEMRSSVATRYHIPDTPPVSADPLMDVDAVLIPQGVPAGGADVTTSAVDVLPSSPLQAVEEIAATTPATGHST